MTKIIGRLIGNGRPVLAWYASPTGLVSALALLGALGLSAGGFAGAAVWILVAWLGWLLPYKLTRERAERSRQVAAVTQRVDRVEANLAATIADLAMTPTIAELAEWQETVERRSAVLLAKVESLDQLRESLRLQRESTQALHDQHASLRTRLDARIASFEEKLERETSAALSSDSSTDGCPQPAEPRIDDAGR